MKISKMRTRQATRVDGKRRKTSEKTAPSNKIEVVDLETVCPICKAEFLDVDDLEVHLKQIHSNDESGPRFCKLCATAFSNVEEFAYHFRDVHLTSTVFCQHCFRAFTDNELLQQHEVKHCVASGSPTVTCSHCPLFFNKTSELRIHEFTEHCESDDGVLLNTALALLSGALGMNIISVIGAVRKGSCFTCQSCSYKSRNLDQYIGHITKRDCKVYVCDKCFTVYRVKTNLIEHMKNRKHCHHFLMEQVKKEKCPSCKKLFEVNAIQDHIGLCNAVKCMKCDIVFKSVSDLSEHRAKEHKMSISVQACKLCGREFVGLINLKKHIYRSHKDISLYKYKCIYCGLLYMHPKKLFAHFFSRHNDIAPYKCKICDKDFKVRKSFTIHIKMVHNSLGFVEFDENLHAFFTDVKSKKPFLPHTPSEVLTYGQIEELHSDSEPSQTACPTQDSESGAETSVTVKSEKTSISTAKSKSPLKQVNSRAIEPSKNVDKPDGNEVTDTHKTNGETKSSIVGEGAGGTIVGNVEPATSNVTDEEASRADDNEYRSLLLSLNQTETEAEQTEAESKPRVLRKRKARTKLSHRKRTKPSADSVVILLSDSEDEALANIRETILKSKESKFKLARKPNIKNNKINLTCNLCNTYCYTYQNYYHHMSFHEGGKMKKCIKCHEVFTCKDTLQSHIKQVHSSSQLTETLKSVLQKRKLTQKTPTPIPVSEKFRRTIKKVEHHDDTVVTITPITEEGLSVRNFIENFKPEVTDSINISNSVTIKTVTKPSEKATVIKMKKFTEETEQSNIGLSMPVAFKEDPGPRYKVCVKLVHKLITNPPVIHFSTPKSTQDDQFDYFDNYNDDDPKNDCIPEVAQEIMLEGTEETPKVRKPKISHQIVIPNLPEKYSDVRIGHLHPEAPFYKIVTMDKILSNSREDKEDDAPSDNIHLSDGTTLVTVNPLAHLLPADQLERVMSASKAKYKYYKPRHINNIQKAIAKAMSPKPYRKK